jgi:hypothetical protein
MAVVKRLVAGVPAAVRYPLMDEAENERREDLPILWTGAAAEAGGEPQSEWITDGIA